MYAHTGAVESLIRGAEVCVCHQLPSSLGNAEENVCTAGRPVFPLCNAHHEDTAGDATGGAATVSEQHTLLFVAILGWYCDCTICANSRVEGKAVCWAQTLRLLSLTDALVSQKACKSAALHLLSGSVSGNEQLADLFPLLLSLLIPPADHPLQQQQCSELVGTILQSLCDQVSCVVHLKANMHQVPRNAKASTYSSPNSPGYLSRGSATW